MQLCDVVSKELVEKEMSGSLVRLLKDTEAEVCQPHSRASADDARANYWREEPGVHCIRGSSVCRLRGRAARYRMAGVGVIL